MKAALLHRAALTPPPQAPPPITAEQASGMSPAERSARAAQVSRFLWGHYFDSERDRAIRTRLNALIQTNTQSLIGTKDVAIVTGPNVMGKSTMLYQVAFEAHREHIAPYDDPDTQPTKRARTAKGDIIEVPRIPVFFLSMAAGTTVAKFNAQIVEAVGYAKEAEKRARYLDIFERHGLRLLIVDDLHLLKTSLKQGREVLDHLKAVVTAVGELGVTVILAGADLHTHPVMDDPQVTGRAYEIPVDPYTAATRENMLTFQRFLREAAAQVQPYLPRQAAGHIHNTLPPLLLYRSAGVQRHLLQLLRDATIAAIEDGSWAITEKHINDVVLALTAERGKPTRVDRRTTPVVTARVATRGATG